MGGLRILEPPLLTSIGSVLPLYEPLRGPYNGVALIPDTFAANVPKLVAACSNTYITW